MPGHEASMTCLKHSSNHFQGWDGLGASQAQHLKGSLLFLQPDPCQIASAAGSHLSAKPDMIWSTSSLYMVLRAALQHRIHLALHSRMRMCLANCYSLPARPFIKLAMDLRLQSSLMPTS